MFLYTDLRRVAVAPQPMPFLDDAWEQQLNFEKAGRQAERVISNFKVPHDGASWLCWVLQHAKQGG